MSVLAPVAGLVPLVEQYVVHLRRRNCSPVTMSGYSFKLRLWFRWLDSEGIDDPGPAEVESFLDSRDFGPRSRYHYLSAISMFYKWALDQDLASSDPTRKIPRPRLPVGLPRPISEESLLVAIDRADNEVAAMLQLAARAGLRCKEIAGVHAGRDLSFGLGPATLRVTAPKGHRERDVPLHPDAVEALRVLGAPFDGFLFPSYPLQNRITPDYTRPAPARTISVKGNQHLHACGISETMHQLRHRFGTVLYQTSKDIRLVQEMLGHRDLGTTAVYTRVDMTEAAKWVTQI